MGFTGMKPWYYKYVGLPYKHLGSDPESGIDCGNLMKLIYKEERGIDIPFYTSDFCNIVDEDWYNKTTDQLFETGIKIERDDFKWQKVSTPRVYDLILMSIGGTNVTNHCAVYVDKGKILHTMCGKDSWVAPYGNYYKQYTTGIYRWAL